MGNAETLQVGDQVLAIGNPFGVGQTVTSGIISALGRSHLGINTFENFIQTDAAINPGNSGGALTDINGNLMGINTAIYSRSGGSMGIGFAIPVSTAKVVLDGIVREGRVTRGWIGVEPGELSPELAQTFGVAPGSGVIIAGVLQAGPAAQAGMQPGDVVRSVHGQPTRTVAEATLTATGPLPRGFVNRIGFRSSDAATIGGTCDGLVNAICDTVHKLAIDAGILVEDIDHFVFHQANERILSQAVKRLGVPDERVVRTLRETGNISSACIPLALDRLANAGALHTGDTIALVGFGAGLDIGGYLLRWK